jgi:hypothetical protein
MPSPRTIGRTSAWIVSLVLLLVIGSLGVYNGLTEWGEGRTVWQQSVTIGVLVYGVLGLVSAYGLFRRQRWSLRTVIAWAIVVTYVPGVAVMADADDAMIGAAIAASAGAALIALGIIWTTNIMTRADQSSVPGS